MCSELLNLVSHSVAEFSGRTRLILSLYSMWGILNDLSGQCSSGSLDYSPSLQPFPLLLWSLLAWPSCSRLKPHQPPCSSWHMCPDYKICRLLSSLRSSQSPHCLSREWQCLSSAISVSPLPYVRLYVPTPTRGCFSTSTKLAVLCKQKASFFFCVFTAAPGTEPERVNI